MKRSGRSCLLRRCALLTLVASSLLAVSSANGQDVTGSGTAGRLPKWTGTSTLGNSLLIEASGKVGIGAATPAFLLEINGPTTGILGVLNNQVTPGSSGGAGVQAFITSVPTAAGQRLGFSTFGVRSGGSSYNSAAIHAYSSQPWILGSARGAYLSFETTPNNTGTRLEQMRIAASGNVGIGTTVPASKLSVAGVVQSTAGGFKFPDGTLQTTAAAGGSGTVIHDATLTGNGTTAFPLKVVTGTFVRNGIAAQSANFNITGSGVIGGTLSVGAGVSTNGAYYLGTQLFLHNFGSSNTFVGEHAGNITLTGTANTASGFEALFSHTTGHYNTANGAGALRTNTSGSWNTASGAFALHDNTTGGNNTAIGYWTLFHNESGDWNTAIGSHALYYNTTGTDNTAVGQNALQANTSGGQNTALGTVALAANTTGNSNTAVGISAMSGNISGTVNTAVGAVALANNTTGHNNTSVGWGALGNNTTGTMNTAVGVSAGVLATTGWNNIYLGSVPGVAGESNTMYLGRVGTQTKTFIAGVYGIQTVSSDAVPVLIDSAGQLGTVSSSRRYKEDIQDMADASGRLFNLRPVTFRYSKAYSDGSKPIQFGLVAEEVANVFPELTVKNSNGDVEAVHYETLSVLLLNELQRQQRELGAERARREEQRQRIDALERQLNELLGQH